ASLESMGEIGGALLGSTLTPVAVLLPLAMLGGVPGAFFRPLALTMSVALLVSLALAFTFTPALAGAASGLRPGRAGVAERLTARLAGVYTVALRAALRWPAVVIAGGVLLCVLGFALYRRLETGFVPVMDEGAFVIDYWAPPGSAMQETERLLQGV